MMMVNIGTGVAPVRIAFSSSRTALIECKILHCTTLSIKLHHCTLSETKTRVCTLPDVLACVSIARIRNNTQTGLFNKIF